MLSSLDGELQKGDQRSLEQSMKELDVVSMHVYFCDVSVQLTRR